MIFHKENPPVKVYCRYTLVEILVVIVVLTIVLAIAANIGVKSQKAVVGQFKKLTSAESVPAESDGKKADASAPADDIQDGKIAVLKQTGATDTTQKSAKKTALPFHAEQQENDPDDIVFPEPEGVIPGKTKLTLFPPEDHKTEPFARYLLKKGSSVSVKEYARLWFVDTQALKKAKKNKFRRGINVPLFSQYLRKKTVFESSPYRAFVLRKRILSASCQAFDPQKSALKYKALAEKKFCALPKGGYVRVSSVDGRVYSGKYNGKVRKQISIKLKETNENCLLPLNQISADQRWKFDTAARNAKREEFVKQALAKEKKIEEKQKEYIRKTLEAEFIMLKEDLLMKKTWQNMKQQLEQNNNAGGR